MADTKWHVVTRNDELDIEAEHASEEPSGSLTFFNERPVTGSGFPSREVVARFAKGDWSRYYRSDKATQAEPGFGVA